MAREKINWKVEKEDVKEIIKPINIEIPIDKGMYSYFLRDGKIKNMESAKYPKYIENEIVDRLYKGKYYADLKSILLTKISLSFVPDFQNDNWKLSYSPVQIINGIFETLNLHERIDYIDYSNEEEVNRIRLYTFMILTRELNDTKDKKRVLFLKDTISGLDNIFLLKDYNIESYLENNISYKDLLYFLSVKSLDILDATDDERYIFIPNQYYLEVSSKGRDGACYPHQMHYGDEHYAANYSNYNDRFSETLMRYPNVFERELGIEEINVMDKIELITADNFIEEVQETYDDYVEYIKKNRKDYTKTNEELNKMLINKMIFYKELMEMVNDEGEKLVVAVVKGKNDLQSHYGFVLRNNYIVLDKFFTKSKTTDKTKPAFDEAIYSMPLDLFVDLNGSKRKMMQYRKNKPKGNLSRNYHTKKCSFKKRIQKIAKKKDDSVMKYDWFLEFYANKILKLNK